MIEVGCIVDDRYEVEELLGEGGLAKVYRVRHAALGSLHALKVLSWERRSMDRRLLLEGRIQAQMRHPNIVSVTDVLRVDGRAALLMEYIDGPGLDAWLCDHGAMEVEAALDLFSHILAAVVCAHDAGVLHRDLKPQNVLLDRQGHDVVAKVTDFGLAKVLDELAAQATRPDAAMGTPGYMAPEQLRDAASADERSDVFALGAILHEMIGGRPAFSDEDGEIALTATLEVEAPPLEGVSDTLRDVVARALAQAPEDRYPDARAFAEALLPPGDPRRERTLAAPPEPLELLQTTGEAGPNTWRTSSTSSGLAPRLDAPPVKAPPSEPSVPEPPRRRRVALTLGVLVALALVLGLGAVGLLGVGWVVSAGVVDSAPTEPESAAVADPAPAPDPRPAPDRPDPAPAPASEAASTPASTAPSQPAEPVVAAGSTAPSPEPEPLVEDAAAPAASEEAVAEPAPEEVAVADAAIPSEDARVEETPEERAQRLSDQMTRDLVGTWKGTAQGRPFQLRILSASTNGVRAELVFNPGPAQQLTRVSGQYSEGQLILGEGALQLRATLRGGTLEGSYSRGKRQVPFQTTR